MLLAFAARLAPDHREQSSKALQEAKEAKEVRRYRRQSAIRAMTLAKQASVVYGQQRGDVEAEETEDPTAPLIFVPVVRLMRVRREKILHHSAVSERGAEGRTALLSTTYLLVPTFAT